MGLRLKSLKYFHEIMDITDIRNFSNLKMCQLGDTKIRQDARRYLYHKHNQKRYFKARIYFTDIGFDVITIDIGVGAEQVDATALNLDLSKPIENLGTFDLVLDFGTGEHIANQFELFRNIHRFCKINGIIVRCNPSNRFGEAHGHGYTFEFYAKLAQLCKYKIIDIRETVPNYGMNLIAPCYRNHLYASMIKLEDSKFSEKDFKIAEKEIKWKEEFPRKAEHKL